MGRLHGAMQGSAVRQHWTPVQPSVDFDGLVVVMWPLSRACVNHWFRLAPLA